MTSAVRLRIFSRWQRRDIDPLATGLWHIIFRVAKHDRITATSVAVKCAPVDFQASANETAIIEHDWTSTKQFISRVIKLMAIGSELEASLHLEVNP